MQSESKTRWLAFWNGLHAKGDSEALYRNLEQRYSEPHRVYHTLRHIEECLTEFALVRFYARDAGAVEMAIWYHDAVYQPRRKDNEEHSATLAREVALGADCSRDFVDRVEKLILASRHIVTPIQPDEQLFTDIDLSILGQNPDRFQEYEQQVRQEYRWVPAPIFRSKRAQILNRFLERPSIYSTTFFRGRYEARARENLLRALDRSG